MAQLSEYRRKRDASKTDEPMPAADFPAGNDDSFVIQEHHARALQAVKTSQDLGLEGVMAKRLTSIYRPGKRTKDWVKVKNVRTQEVVIGGWTPGQGNRAGTIGALLLGLPTEDGLAFIGKVGTGFTQRILDDLQPRLHRLERKTTPFTPAVPRADAKDAHWVTPKLVGDVAFSEWTDDLRLRHPAWRGLRDDKSADQVVKES